jgi:hypothetical protein
MWHLNKTLRRIEIFMIHDSHPNKYRPGQTKPSGWEGAILAPNLVVIVIKPRTKNERF